MEKLQVIGAFLNFMMEAKTDPCFGFYVLKLY